MVPWNAISFPRQNDTHTEDVDTIGLRLELGLGVASSVDADVVSGTTNGGELGVDEGGTGPGLVGEDLNPLLALDTLDLLNVASHVLVGDELTREEIGNHTAAVETGERDELEHEAFLAEVSAEALDLSVGHARSIPVEAGAEVVGEELLGANGLDALSEFAGLGNTGLGGLHPEEVSVGGEGLATGNAGAGVGLEAVEAIAATGVIPVPAGHVAD